MRLMFSARAIGGVAGGVERIIAMVMNALAARGHDVDLLTWDLAGAEAFYPVSPGIMWHRLNLGDPNVKASKRLLLQRAQAIRSLIRQRRPQAIICFQDGPFMAIRAYACGLRIPMVAAERNAPTRFRHTAAARQKTIIYQSLRLADRIAIQFESYRALYPKYLHKKIVCIPNPVYPAELRARPDHPDSKGRFQLLSVGRLSYQKNYGVLVEAFAEVAAMYREWHLTIIGEGEDRTKLEATIVALKLENRVSLPGTKTSLAGCYASSHAFCLPSRWEGFPNALAEAFAHGLPGIGFAECAGVSDLIDHGLNGLLAEGNGNSTSLALTLKEIFGNGAMRSAMGSKAVSSVARFDPVPVFSLWENVISEIAVA